MTDPGDRESTEADRELIIRARNGCRVSMGGVFARVDRMLKVTVAGLRTVGLGARAGAADHLQETYLHMCQQFRAFHGKEMQDCANWAERILRNVVKDACDRHVQAAKRSVRREVRLTTDFSDQSDSFRSLDELISVESAESLDTAVQHLNISQRSVIRKCILESKPESVTAEEMMLSVSRVHSLKAKALQLLRNDLSPLSPEGRGVGGEGLKSGGYSTRI